MTGSDVFSSLTPTTIISERVICITFQNKTELAKSKNSCHG